VSIKPGQAQNDLHLGRAGVGSGVGLVGEVADREGVGQLGQPEASQGEGGLDLGEYGVWRISGEPPKQLQSDNPSSSSPSRSGYRAVSLMGGAPLSAASCPPKCRAHVPSAAEGFGGTTEPEAQPSGLRTSRGGVEPTCTPSLNATHLGRAGVGLVGEGADREGVGLGVDAPGFPSDSIAQGEAATSRLRQPLRLQSIPEGHESQGAAVAFLLDLAGQDESRMDDLLGKSSSDETPLDNPARDSACLSIVSIDLSTLVTLQAPTYRILHRLQWVGVNHLTLFGQLKALAESWHPQYIVMDSTGVGEGLWALMDKTFPKRVIPVKFNLQVKSELGWKFLSIIDTGRFRDSSGGKPSWGAGGNSQFSLQTGSIPSPDLVRLQYISCRSEALPGPSKTLRWGVPDGARGPDGQLIHDDILLADALVAALDSLEWVVQTHVVVIEGFDPLSSRERFLSHVKIAF